MGARVFLTGISGYLGETLAEHLAQTPDVECVTGISRSSPRKPLPAKVQYVKMDMRSPDLAAAMAGHDVVMHTAIIVTWLAHMSEAERDDINLNGIRNVASAAVTAGVEKFIQASSVAVYFGNAPGREPVTEDAPLNDGHTSWYYANAKAVCERTLIDVVQSAGIPLALLRPPWIVGPRNRATVSGFRATPVRFQGGDPRLQFVHEDDVADAFVLAMRKDLAGAYNVAADGAIPWSTVLKMIGVRYAPAVPLWLARIIGTLQWRYLGGLAHPSWIEAFTSDRVASNARLKAAGWQPRYNSTEALRSAV